MHTWKDFLEQDKEYDSLDLHIAMAEDLKHETFEAKVDIVNEAFKEETTILDRLFQDRKGGGKASSDGDKREKKTRK